MQIALYKNKSDKIVARKSIGDPIATISGIVVKEDGLFSTKNPTVILQLDGDWTDITDFNYCRIYQTDRYYYVTNHVAEGGLLRLELETDVLMSFKDDIYRTDQRQQIIERQENKYSDEAKLLPDEYLPIRADHYYQSKVFGKNVSDFTSQRIIVETAGRGGRIV